MTIESLKRVTGLYILYGEYELPLYVGKSTCLMTRLTKHMRRKDVVDVEVIDLTEDMEGLNHHDVAAMLRFREAQLIREIDPIENIQRPNLTMDYIHKLPIAVLNRLVDSIPCFTGCDTKEKE